MSTEFAYVFYTPNLIGHIFFFVGDDYCVFVERESSSSSSLVAVVVRISFHPYMANGRWWFVNVCVFWMRLVSHRLFIAFMRHEQIFETKTTAQADTHTRRHKMRSKNDSRNLIHFVNSISNVWNRDGRNHWKWVDEHANEASKE